MTETRAIAKIRYRIDTASQLVGNGADGKEFEDLEMAIQALSEIQQYRAIGTIDALKADKVIADKAYRFIMDDIEMLLEYQAIGTVEEIQLIFSLCKDLKDVIKQYERIGTIDKFKELKEKSEPKKPLCIPTDDTCLYYEYVCPTCNEWLSGAIKRKYCGCGQCLRWNK